MSSPASILLIIPFFGPWPKWTPTFLESCRLNIDIDWILFGDHPFPCPTPPNVRFQKMGLYALLARAKMATGFDVQKENYSQCDMRPAYGKIFADYTKGYDFWGHSDIDVLWGRLRQFLTNRILENYSIISTMKERVSGPLTLYRNTPEINNFFLEIPDCRKKLEFPMWVSFDEILITRHIRRLLTENRLPFRIFWENDLIVDRSKLRRSPHGWIWEEGKILNIQRKECMCLHFGVWRHAFRSTEFEASQGPLYMTRFGIFNKPFPRLHYWKLRVEDIFCLRYWRWRLAEACRNIFRMICSMN